MLVILDRLFLLALKILVLGVESCIERRLKRVRVQNPKLLEHNKACGCIFVSLVRKLTVVKGEQAVLLGQEVGQDLDQVIVLMLVDLALTRNAPIHEDIALPTMAMHIAEEDNLVFLVILLDELLGEMNSWVE